MRRLELDFLREPAAPRWPGVVLLLVAVAFLVDLGRSYVALDEQIAQNEARLGRDRLPVSGEGLMRASTQVPSAQEIGAARGTIRRLSTPWDNLFRALEFAQLDSVALLSIEPDPEAGSVAITGEAKNYLAALSYVATLSSSKTLREVRLAKHETKQGDPQRPVLFTVTALWMEKR